MKTFGLILLSALAGACITAQVADRYYIPAAKSEAIVHGLQMVIEGEELFPAAQVAKRHPKPPPVPQWKLENAEFQRELEAVL